ncbi:ATP-dependent DNA helicase PIF1 [Hypoxylon sp. NC0597]|nr:ATP-dependent DNA helicase PIF1 [Hypoxylon sp. NC0597]
MEARKDGKPNPEPKCRFFFPREPREAPAIVEKEGRSWYTFEAERNDTHLNQFSRMVSLCWLANIDISPYTSVQAVINYAAKYCSKGETPSTTYAEIAKDILPHVTDTNPILSFVSKMMNKLIGERDYSAQEICHVLLGLPLQEDSRVIRNVDCRRPDSHSRLFDINNNGQLEETSTLYEKYLQRPSRMDAISYFQFLEMWNFSSRDPERWNPWQRPARAHVLLYFPRYKPIPTHPQFPEFCRVKLMLNHPHRNHNKLLQLSSERFHTYQHAFLRCSSVHTYPDNHYSEVDQEALKPEEDEFERPSQAVEDITIEDWHEIARLVPDLQADQETANLLGRRDVNINYD